MLRGGVFSTKRPSKAAPLCEQERMSSSDANANASAGPLMEWKAKYGQDIVAFKVHGAKMFLGTYHGVPGACDARVCVVQHACATCVRRACVCDVWVTCVCVRAPARRSPK